MSQFSYQNEFTVGAQNFMTAEAQYLPAEQKGVVEAAARSRLPRRVAAALNEKRRDGTLVRDGKRDGLIVFRLALPGEGMKDLYRVDEYKRRNAKRSQTRLDQRRRSRPD